MASAHITSDMVEVSEFSHLGVKYGVRGVPHTIINEKENLIGSQPEMEVVKAALKAIGK